MTKCKCWGEMKLPNPLSKEKQEDPWGTIRLPLGKCSGKENLTANADKPEAEGKGASGK